MNAGEIWVSMDQAADYDQTLAAIRSTVDGYPGLDRTVTTYPADRIAEVFGPGERDVAVRVYGQDLAILGIKAEEVRTAMSEITGIDAPSVTAPITEPTVEIEVDLEKAAAHGLKPGDVRRAATSLLSGIQVGSLFEEQKVFEVVVWGTPELRTSVDSIRDLQFDAPSGALVRLRDVASVRVQPSPSVIDREGVMRYLDVTADVAGRDLGAVIGDLETRLASIPFANEYHAEIRSAAMLQQEAQTRLFAVVAGVAILVLLLLQAAFGAWRLAFLVLLALPVAVVGGIIATLATGDLFTIGAVAGLILVGSITVRHAIALVDRFRQLEAAGEASSLEVALAGVQERLLPILTTVLGTAAFSLPFIALGDVAGLEIMRPVAIFVLGGLISSLVLLLFLLPSIYTLSGPSPESETATLLSEPPAFEPTAA